MGNKSTLKDYKIALNLLKNNIRPFFIILLLGTVLFFSFDYLFYNILFENFLVYQTFPQNISYGLIRIPADAIIFGFFGVSMGMGYDIMTLGDEFAQLRNSVYYIRKYWLKYFFLSIILNWFIYLIRFLDPIEIGLELDLLIRFCSFCWFVSIAEAYPAILNRQSFIQALRDNFILLRNNFSRIFKTFSIYYAIFLLPRSILTILSYTYPFTDLTIIIRILTIIYIIIGFPIFAFLSIGIYNSELKFKEN
jgi:hypothetical protein